ncbi:hypothetical protein BDV95DRAFT_593403 [Massariosphaeria phaeospora]|uniref:Uncharacterized protein n=1 Tax=Massariosphaeria phaeospora TaxID=100035 RepID=A0A7C8MBW7_9PLEO|nr:hypothetical protein BDV95DRAFT_593403 [Massariosphaeria phaeospora]
MTISTHMPTPSQPKPTQSNPIQPSLAQPNSHPPTAQYPRSLIPAARNTLPIHHSLPKFVTPSPSVRWPPLLSSQGSNFSEPKQLNLAPSKAPNPPTRQQTLREKVSRARRQDESRLSRATSEIYLPSTGNLSPSLSIQAKSPASNPAKRMVWTLYFVWTSPFSPVPDIRLCLESPLPRSTPFRSVTQDSRPAVHSTGIIPLMCAPSVDPGPVPGQCAENGHVHTYLIWIRNSASTEWLKLREQNPVGRGRAGYVHTRGAASDGDRGSNVYRTFDPNARMSDDGFEKNEHARDRRRTRRESSQPGHSPVPKTVQLSNLRHQPSPRQPQPNPQQQDAVAHARLDDYWKPTLHHGCAARRFEKMVIWVWIDQD